MKKIHNAIISWITLVCCEWHAVSAQQIPASSELSIEQVGEDATTENDLDDSYELHLEQFQKHPIDLNTADGAILRELGLLNDLQIDQLLLYRKMLGRLVSIYEMQSIPYWDIATIKKVLPFICVTDVEATKTELLKRFRNGQHTLITRVSGVMEKSAGYESGNNSGFLGKPVKFFIRHSYQYKDLLRYGIVAEKDPGETFGKGAQRLGFDFYSFHLALSRIGRIRLLVLGDFTVNLGQGLIQWQSMGFKKNSEVLLIKRQSSSIRPYHSAGEFFFHRGAAITMQQRRLALTLFASTRKLSANLNDQASMVTSMLTSGYNRTSSEGDKKNILQQFATGGNVTYTNNSLQLALNAVYYRFGLPIQKGDDPYELFAINGDSWFNYSIDYSFTHKNIHFYGETALDKNHRPAMVNGLIASVDPIIDIALLHRAIHPAYQAVYANAFTENSTPSNERGWYAGMQIRPAYGWKLNMYADLFYFPWLKFTVDAPSHGKEVLVQLTYNPVKHTEIYSRFRLESKDMNYNEGNAIMQPIVTAHKINWRTHLTTRISSSITFRNRIELCWAGEKDKGKATGYLGYIDVLYKPSQKPFDILARLQTFESSAFTARVYAYENDVQYSYAVPAFFDKGFRYYVVVKYDIHSRITAWLRWAQTMYDDVSSLGSGLDEIAGNKRTEIKLQLRYIFR